MQFIAAIRKWSSNLLKMHHTAYSISSDLLDAKVCKLLQLVTQSDVDEFY